MNENILQRARDLGIPESQSEYFWIAEQSLSALLPEGWEQNEGGFWHPQLKKQQEEHPCIEYYRQLYKTFCVDTPSETVHISTITKVRPIYLLLTVCALIGVDRQQTPDSSLQLLDVSFQTLMAFCRKVATCLSIFVLLSIVVWSSVTERHPSEWRVGGFR